MKITQTVMASGHFINIDTGTIKLVIMTEQGKAEELRATAIHYKAKAERLLRDAALIESAAQFIEGKSA